MSSTKDIAIFVESAPFYEHSLFPPNEAEALVTGPEKVAQKFIMRLMTGRNSMLYMQGEGCIFPEQILFGYVSTEADLMQLFAMSLVSIRGLMALDETDDTPDDERFSNAELSNIVITQGVTSVTIKVSTADGSVVDKTIPITFEF